MLRACWHRTDALLRDLQVSLRAAPEPSFVSLAVPAYERPEVHAFRARERDGRPPLASHQPALWMNALLSDRDVEVRSLVLVERDPLVTGPVWAYEEREGDRRLVVERGATIHVLDSGARAARSDSTDVVHIDSVPAPSGSHFLYFHDGERGRMIDLRAAAPLASPARPEPEG